MRAAVFTIALLAAGPVLAQDPGAELRLQNQIRWNEGQIRNLEADLGRLRTDQTIRGLQAQRLPDPILSARQNQLDAVEAENLNRAAQAASTARAARLRAASPVYDQRLRDLGYATGLPADPR